MPKDNTPEQTPADRPAATPAETVLPAAKKARVSRRVQWTQPGSTENPKSSDSETPERDRPENWGDRTSDKNSGNGSNSNDEQLKRDKPPHWG